MPDYDEEEDDIEGATAAPPPPVSANGVNGTAAATAPPRPKARTPKKGESHTQAARGGVGIGAFGKSGVPALDAPYENRDADLVWPELLQRLRDNGYSEYQVQCRVERTMPGDKVKLGTFECSSIVGDEKTNPGDALRQRVTDDYHMAYSQWPAKYDCVFLWTINGQIITRSSIGLPAPAQINAFREAEARKLAASGQALPPQGYGAPQPQQRYEPPMRQTYQPAPGEDPTVANLRAQLAQASAREEYFKGITDEIRRANAEGRQPNLPREQPGLGAAPQGMEERLAGVMERGFMKLADALTNGRASAGHQGLGQQPQPQRYEPPPPPQYAPPPPPAPAPVDPLVAMAHNLTQKMLERTLNKVSASMERTMDALDENTGLGAPDTEEPSAPLAPAPPPPEEDFKTWKGSKSDFGTWSDGRPVIFPAKKDGGGIDAVGALFENPIIAETLMGGMNNLMEAATDAIKKVASGESQHVRRVGPMGVGAPPQQPPPALHGGVPSAPQGGGTGFDE